MASGVASQPDATETKEATMKRILLAYDGSDVDDRALETAVELAKAFGAAVSVVSVVELMPARAGGAMPWDVERHTADLDAAVAKLRDHGITADDAFMPTGDPKRTIEAIADRGHFDTIVVGHNALSPIQRLFDVSVARHVATHTDSDVVIVH
jgi:nucleotide-binding universal stress UspA family protein